MLHVCSYPQKAEELTLKAAVSHPMWVLGTKLKTSRRETNALNH